MYKIMGVLLFAQVTAFPAQGYGYEETTHITKTFFLHNQSRMYFGSKIFTMTYKGCPRWHTILAQVTPVPKLPQFTVALNNKVALDTSDKEFSSCVCEKI